MYYLQVIVRRKITLKINAGNEKDSFNVTLHKIKWKSIFDVKKYILERNWKYAYDRQTIKYMGNILPNKDVTFEVMNRKIDLIIDIIIEELILQEIANEKIYSLMKYGIMFHHWLKKKYWIIHSSQIKSCNEKAIINFFILIEIIFWNMSNKYPIKSQAMLKVI